MAWRPRRRRTGGFSGKKSDEKFFSSESAYRLYSRRSTPGFLRREVHAGQHKPAPQPSLPPHCRLPCGRRSPFLGCGSPLGICPNHDVHVPLLILLLEHVGLVPSKSLQRGQDNWRVRATACAEALAKPPACARTLLTKASMSCSAVGLEEERVMTLVSVVKLVPCLPSPPSSSF